jgi:hypothetical protein
MDSNNEELYYPVLYHQNIQNYYCLDQNESSLHRILPQYTTVQHIEAYPITSPDGPRIQIPSTGEESGQTQDFEQENPPLRQYLNSIFTSMQLTSNIYD